MSVVRRLALEGGDSGRPKNWSSAAAKVCLILGGALALLAAVALGSFVHANLPVMYVGVALVAVGGILFLLSLFLGYEGKR